MAGPSEVLVSNTVKDLVVGSDLTFDHAGRHELKGVPHRWRLHEVVGESPGRGLAYKGFFCVMSAPDAVQKSRVRLRLRLVGSTD